MLTSKQAIERRKTIQKMRAQGMTLQEIANVFGTTRQAVSHYLRSKEITVWGVYKSS